MVEFSIHGLSRPWPKIEAFEDYIMYFLTHYPAVANFGTLVVRVLMR